MNPNTCLLVSGSYFAAMQFSPEIIGQIEIFPYYVTRR